MKRLFAVEMVRGQGHVVDLEGNGLEAVDSLKRIPYDSVLLNCQISILDQAGAPWLLPAEGDVLDSPILVRAISWRADGRK